MRIAVVSDIHGNLAALEAVVADIKQRGVDAVVNLGDSLSGPLLPLETAQFLMAQDWVHLAGNHERQLLNIGPNASESDRYAYSQLSPSELAWIATLPHTRYFTSDVLLCHGAPGSDVTCLLQNAECAASAVEVEQRLGDVDAELILCGHSHVPRQVRCRGKLVVNPGSVGQPAFADDYPYPHVIETGSPDARYALLEGKGAAWCASLIAVPYPFASMAELAKKRKRPDWVCALLTGYMS